MSVCMCLNICIKVIDLNVMYDVLDYPVTCTIHSVPP